MNQRDTKRDAEISLHPHLKQYGWRVLEMTVLWLAFGMIVGSVIAPPGAIGLVASAIAGVIVVTPLGFLLGLLGGRWRETLLCGLIGLCLGTMGGALGDTERTGFFAAVGLVYGGIVGATFVSFFYRLPRLVVGLIRQQA